MNLKIEPFVGVDDYKLMSTLSELIEKLTLQGVDYTTEIWPNEECSNPVPWTIVRTSNGMNFFFAKDKMFKIYVEDGYKGYLPNGIGIGTEMKDAKAIDPELEFDDWEEDWQSPKGYWLEDDLDTKKVMTITVFIRELLDEESFDKYEW